MLCQNFDYGSILELTVSLSYVTNINSINICFEYLMGNTKPMNHF